MINQKMTVEGFQLLKGMIAFSQRIGLLNNTDVHMNWSKRKPELFIDKEGELRFIEPNEVYPVTVELWTNYYAFQPFQSFKFYIVDK